MTNLEMTIAEAMALAVLKGDTAAAYALCDKLLEQRENPKKVIDEAWKILATRPGMVTGYEVYHWPEFQAFMTRLGIPIGLYNIEMDISLRMDEMVKVSMVNAGCDTGAANTLIDTTTHHNEVFATSMPNPAGEIDEEAFTKP